MSNFSLSFFRNHEVVWILLVIFFFSCVPSVTRAQQPTATISALSGTVLVNGQAGNTGIVLSAGDVIETQAGASVVLELSDGSLLELGKKTNVDMTVLLETATGARVSRIKLMWGWVRAKLSSNHQHVGSSFDIETPNALVGVKFSEPDIEVSYNPESVETVGIAHTVELLAKNLLTDEEVLVPVGSTVIIVGLTIKIMAGIAVGTVAAEAAGAGATETTATGAGTTAGAAKSGTAASGAATGGGMGKGTMIAIGAGALAAAGAGTAVVVSNLAEEGDESDFSFTGRFANHIAPGAPYFILHEVYTLTQEGASVTGSFSITSSCQDCCENSFTLDFTGTVNKGVLTFSLPQREERCPLGDVNLDGQPDFFYTTIVGGTYTATLLNDGNTFAVQGPPDCQQYCFGAGVPYTREQ